MQLIKIEDFPKLEDIHQVSLKDPIKIFKICQEMEFLCESKNYKNLSAVQIGNPLDLFIVKSDGNLPFVEKGKYGYFANTTYKATDKKQIVSLEGCPSIRSQDGQLRFFQVDRYYNVKIVGKLLCVKDKIIKFVDFDVEMNSSQGIIFQQKIDLSSCVTISNKGREIFVW